MPTPLHVALRHTTRYQYDRPVQLGPQLVRLRPAPQVHSPVVSYAMLIQPPSHVLHWQQDPFANYQARLTFPDKTTEFSITVDLVVCMTPRNPFDFFLEPAAVQVPMHYPAPLAHDLAPYLATEPATPQLLHYLGSMAPVPCGTVDFLVGLNQAVQRDIQYQTRMEPGVQTPDETLSRQSGSCRDSAWLLVQLLRHSGLAARFVSGYLIQLKPDTPAPDAPTTDSAELHAWAEVYLPGAGWIGLDGTSGLLTGPGHIPLACAPRPDSAAPVEGGLEAAQVHFGYEMTVTRIPSVM